MALEEQNHSEVEREEAIFLWIPIKFWFFALTVVHFCLLAFAVYHEFYLFCDTVLVVLSLLVVFLPHYFFNFYHFVIQLSLWGALAVAYSILLGMEVSKQRRLRILTLFLLLIVFATIFTVLYTRLLIENHRRNRRFLRDRIVERREEKGPEMATATEGNS